MLFIRRTANTLLAATTVAMVIACGGGPPKPTPQPAANSLNSLAGLHIAVLPAFSIRVEPDLGWAGTIGRPADVQKTMDADLVAAFEERGIRKAWVFPEQLATAYRRNPTYAADPYALALEPLRSPALKSEVRLPEPLASQVRTLVALHNDTRLVLAPVELRFEKAGTGGRGVLRLVLVDARLSNVRWIGEISSDTVTSFGPAITASIAARFASAVSAP